MRTSMNIWVQLLALATFAALRLSAPGWMLVILILTGVPLVLACTPLVAALVVRKRGQLDRQATAPFLACAGLMVLAGALVADFGDTDEVRIPVLPGQALTYDSPLMALNTVGFVFVALYPVALVWLLVALITTRRS